MNYQLLLNCNKVHRAPTPPPPSPLPLPLQPPPLPLLSPPPPSPPSPTLLSPPPKPTSPPSRATSIPTLVLTSLLPLLSMVKRLSTVKRLSMLSLSALPQSTGVDLAVGPTQYTLLLWRYPKAHPSLRHNTVLYVLSSLHVPVVAFAELQYQSLVSALANANHFLLFLISFLISFFIVSFFLRAL
jgi:hypothetical protein